MLTDLTIRVAPTLHWLEAFGLWLHNTPTPKNKHRSPKTIESYLLDVSVYQRYFEKVNGIACAELVEALNSTDMGAYFDQLEKNAKFSTYNRKHASLHMLVKFARENGLIDYDPMAWIPRLDAVRVTPRDLDQNEQHALKAALDELPQDTLGLRDRILIELMLNAGLRIHEAVGLKRSDIHLDKKNIHVIGKGKKERTVNINNRLIGYLRTWLDLQPAPVGRVPCNGVSRPNTDEHLFPGENGTALTTGQARVRFYAVRDAAGLDDTITPHAMRHTYINNMLRHYSKVDPREGVAIKTVCRLTGDDPRVILDYYTNPRESDIRAAVEML